MEKLERDFFNRNTLKVAKDLLGKYLVRSIDSKKYIGKIIETEAYMGIDDHASHASRGKTKRTEIMFGKAGIAYVYLIYGMYHCFNIVTEKEKFPAAVLVRAIEPINELTIKTNGPGKLCRFIKIDKALNGEDLISSKKLWIEDRGERTKKSQIVSKKRVGVDYAKHCKNYPWRFYIKDSPFVFKK